MPIFDYGCSKCGAVKEVIILHGESSAPECCGEFMTRRYTAGKLTIKMGYPGWVDRIDEIHKRQADRGERLRLPHPKEVGAT